MQQVIPIFCASDDNYAGPLAIMMRSILEHTQHKIEFYVMDGGISAQSKAMINKDLEAFQNYSIQYIDMSAFDISQFGNVERYTVNTFSRYFVPELARGKEKVLYLDADIVVQQDIATLFNQDLEGAMLGVVADMAWVKKLSPEQFQQSQDLNFNAGVMLMDVPALLEQNFTQKLLDKTFQLGEGVSFPDQTVLNLLFKKHSKLLENKYNFQVSKHYKMVEKPFDDDTLPVVIHYVGAKPWEYSSLYGALFWQIAEKSEFLGVLREMRFEKFESARLEKLPHYNVFSLKNGAVEFGILCAFFLICGVFFLIGKKLFFKQKA